MFRIHSLKYKRSTTTSGYKYIESVASVQFCLSKDNKDENLLCSNSLTLILFFPLTFF